MQLVTLIWALNNSPNHHPYANIGANTTKVTFQKIQLDNLEKMTLIHLGRYAEAYLLGCTVQHPHVL